MTGSTQESSSLDDWNNFSGTNWESILLGNGASRAVWEDFRYPSLFEVAKSGQTSHALLPEDEQLFNQLGKTRNFEAVLGALLTSKTVCAALGIPADKINERYDSIRDALVSAVHRVHVAWSSIPSATLGAIRDALLAYDYIFSTNYDLLIYWSIMSDNPSPFRDYFWGSQFDIANSEVWGKATKILYLHGALHLYYSQDGGTYKESAGQFANLLDIFAQRPDAVPLCITEGSAQQKLAAIGRSDYLSFCLQQLSRTKGPIVLLGQALGETDEHLAELLGRQHNRIVGVGIYPTSATQTIEDKAHFRKLLPHAHLLFFDSRSHPLALPALRVVS